MNCGFPVAGKLGCRYAMAGADMWFRSAVMPRRPSVCWDAHNQRFRSRIKGKSYILGRDIATAHECLAFNRDSQ